MRLLFAGLVTVDLVQRVQRFPGADEKVQSESVDVAAGGPAANAAVTAAALGATVTLVSAVGSHPLGDLVRADLAAHGVTLIDATPDSPEPPPVSAVTVLASTGERTIVSRNAGNRQVAPVSLPEADLTLVDGHHPALAVAAARSARRLLVDAGSWRPVFAEVFPHAEVVACSGDFRHPDATDRTDAATAAAIGAPTVVITHGPEPVRWFSRAAAGETPAPRDAAGETSVPRVAAGESPVPRVAAVDTAGAGDAFHGALAVALARGDLILPDAVAYACRIAAVRVRHAGPRAWLAHLP
ncbi:PfkB family carbohydrate kinase [Actinoplanes sp. CA-252034]|uniref:PfkB family carbohydrate kinase n=1 Tax=Actinoplanes sp. CA-252034 TaxID=3239906 RepID=UPI003D98E9AC